MFILKGTIRIKDRRTEEVITWQVERETEKALLVKENHKVIKVKTGKETPFSDGEREFWLPKSQVEEIDDFFLLPVWLVEKNDINAFRIVLTDDHPKYGEAVSSTDLVQAIASNQVYIRRGVNNYFEFEISR